MLIIYCDGSNKIAQSCVVTSNVCGRLLTYQDKKSNQRTVVKELLYCSKKTYNNYYNDNIHELLAILDAMETYQELTMSLDLKEPLLIISDSKEMVLHINQLLETNIWKGKELSVELMTLLTEKIDFIKSIGQTISIEWHSRNILGLNVADFLNKESQFWTNNKDKPFLKSQMKKLLNSDYHI